MSLPNLSDINKGIEAGGKAISSQSQEANKRPLSWAAVIGVVFGALAIIFLVGWLISDNITKGKRIAVLEAQKNTTDSMSNARVDATRFYYDKNMQEVRDENKKLWYKIGGMDAKKATDDAK